MKGAALAACDEIVDVLLGTERVAGVNAGESTLRVFLAVLDSELSVLMRRSDWLIVPVQCCILLS